MHRSQGRDQIAQLEPFFDQGLIEDVIGLIKTGKEASVFCCRAGAALADHLEQARGYAVGGSMALAGVTPRVSRPGLVAAKVYRAAQYRFKNDAVYQEARARELGLRGSALRAFEKRRHSTTGRQVQAGTWQHREYDCLEELYDAGADVPKPIAAAENAILMEYFGDEVEAAQQLNRVRLGAAEAGPLFQRLMNNIELFLAMNRVHGDLSPHNILYLQGDMRIIDFPQAVDPRFNRHAHDLLARDVDNVCRYFTAYGVEADAWAVTEDLWRRFTYSQL
jgi:RIO kinase 1